jgi:hypothetical protein
MLIDPSIEFGVFVPEATMAMGEAFEAACREFPNASPSKGARELVAKRIIAAARRGELCPVRLRIEALSGLPLAKMSPAT